MEHFLINNIGKLKANLPEGYSCKLVFDEKVMPLYFYKNNVFEYELSIIVDGSSCFITEPTDAQSRYDLITLCVEWLPKIPTYGSLRLSQFAS